MEINNEYDIIIVGAGPAGISTALHIAKSSPELAKRTLVLERFRHPRRKLCAGGILPDGGYILKRIGLNLSEVDHVSVKEVCLYFKNHKTYIKKTPEAFRVVKREEFDHWLVNEARKLGIRILEETEMLNITVDSGGAIITTDKGVFSCRAVVAADGSNSTVRKHVLGKVPTAWAVALETVVRPDKNIKDSDGCSKNNSLPYTLEQAYFDFTLSNNGLQGYIWNFPVKNGISNRGIYNSRLYYKQSDSRRMKQMLSRQLEDKGINLEDQIIEGNLINCFSPNIDFSVPGVLFTGDAAGIDPLFGEGISFALGYGEIAATELIAAFESNDFTFFNYKANIFSHPMGKVLNRRYKIARFFYHPTRRVIPNFIWNIDCFTQWYVKSLLMDWAK